jgi:hypothetical protein
MSFFEFNDTPKQAQYTPPSAKKPPKGGVVLNTSATDFFSGEGTSFDFDIEKNKFVQHMGMLKNQSVQENTLYKKWKELTTDFNNTKDIQLAQIVEAKIWRPTDITNKNLTVHEINAIDPEIIIVEPEDIQYFNDWKYIRVFCHTMEFTANVGRLIRVLIRDRSSGKYVGAASLGSDVASINVRDQWIGWSKENKFTHGLLNSTAICTTIIPTQPFGYNFLGGKMIASLLTTKVIRDEWKRKFGNVLVGVTTTSLYGSHSMYQRIPFWKELGVTAGKISLKPDDDVFEKWANYLKVNHSEGFDKCTIPYFGDITQEGQSWICTDGTTKITASSRDELVSILENDNYSVHSTGEVYDKKCRCGSPPTGPKLQQMLLLYKILGIKPSDYEHGFQRGVYFAPMYENAREFLRGEINEDKLILSQKLTNDVESVMLWWRDKAIKRYLNLFDNNRLNGETLYYRKMIQMTWEESKNTYLGEVGR